MAKPQVVKTEQKGAGHYAHWLTDGRYVLETRGAGSTKWGGAWSLWKPLEGNSMRAKFLHSASSLGKLLKWAEKNPPR